MARTGYTHMLIPNEQYEKLKELKDLLHARTWAELVDKIYEVMTSKTLEEACSKICETRRRPPILQALQA